jgi:peptidyl-tRNA hydrolase
MTTGKAMAQAGHAAQLGWRAMDGAARAAWRDRGFELAVRDATLAQWSTELAAGAPVVHDAGFTEVSPNSQTALFSYSS